MVTKEKVKEKRKVRIIKIQIEYQLKTNTTSRNFKKQYPDFRYDRKTKTYTLPKSIIKEIIIQPPPTKKGKPSQKKSIDVNTLKLSKEQPPKQPLPSERNRISVNLYMKLGSEQQTPDGTEIGYAEIRATTINPDYTERGLKILVLSIREKLEQKGYNFNHLYTTIGYEQTKLSPSEEKILNDYQIHITEKINAKTKSYVM